jgi:hypothetical protein
MKGSKMVAALGISNLVTPYLAAIMPAIGPRITIANEKGSCQIPTPNALRPNLPTDAGVVLKMGTAWNVRT